MQVPADAADTTDITPISSNDQSSSMINLRIRGLGHDIILKLSPCTTLSSLQSQIEFQTGLPPPYQRIICNGRTLNNTSTHTNVNVNAHDKTSHANANEDNGPSLTQLLGITKRGNTITKAILMHNSNYMKDREKVELILKLSHELENLELKCSNNKGCIPTSILHSSTRSTCSLSTRSVKNIDSHGDGDDDGNDENFDKKLVSHLITEICCKLDAIDVSTSSPLRLMRKRVLQRADELEKSIHDVNGTEQKSSEE
mmetsp:Transcript_8306/g.10519  ORF Transcript_8306/g.10519 Transcript_8306/m.10519 type:complete len:256 (-) Transcript_8306:108-875(-)